MRLNVTANAQDVTKRVAGNYSWTLSTGKRVVLSEILYDNLACLKRLLKGHKAYISHNKYFKHFSFFISLRIVIILCDQH
jgi:hypothetical protein